MLLFLFQSWGQSLFWEINLLKKSLKSCFTFPSHIEQNSLTNLKRERQQSLLECFMLFFIQIVQVVSYFKLKYKRLCLVWGDFHIAISFVSWSSTYINSSYKDHCSRTKFCIYQKAELALYCVQHSMLTSLQATIKGHVLTTEWHVGTLVPWRGIPQVHAKGY